jgi:hypothetical protein
VIECFDRVVLLGTYQSAGWPEAMEEHLRGRGTTLMDFHKSYANELRLEAANHILKLAVRRCVSNSERMTFAMNSASAAAFIVQRHARTGVSLGGSPGGEQTRIAVSGENVPRAARGDAGILEHERGEAERAGFARVVGDEEHSGVARVGLAADFGKQFGFEREVEAGEWFVEQEQVRLRRQRAGEGDALLLADGECAGTARGEFADVAGIERGLRGGVAFGTRQAGQSEGDVFERGEIRPEREVLENHADTEAGSALDGAGARRVEAGDEAEQRAFSRAAGAEDGEALAGCERKAHALEDGVRAVVFGEVADGEERVHAERERRSSAMLSAAASAM